MSKRSSKVKIQPTVLATTNGDNQINAHSTDATSTENNYMANVSIYICPNGMGKKRVDIFKNALDKIKCKFLNENDTIDFESSLAKWIVVVDESFVSDWEQVEKALGKKKFFLSFKQENSNLFDNDFDEVTIENFKTLPFRIVNSKWLSECLKQKKFISTDEYQILPAVNKSNRIRKRPNEKDVQLNQKEKLSESEDESLMTDGKKKKLGSEIDSALDALLRQDAASYLSGDEDEAPDVSSKKKPKTENFTCAHSSKETVENPNKIITDKLEEMASIYESTRDRFRAISYQKAAMALKQIKEPIKSKEEALKIPGVGKAIATKIFEIIETGELKKLDNLKEREDIAIMKLFTNMHGVGPTTAQSFISQGFKTLEDLETKANLNRQQKIGLKYYHEFLQRIPRDEVTMIEEYVANVAKSINSDVVIQACGSYRRGKATCGDVDILVTHPDGKSHKTIFPQLVDLLHQKNFLTDDLVYQEDSPNDSQRKYLGVCLLPKENSLHRRLDLISVPYDEYACALLYFTGSAHFNRSMRLLARNFGYSLSEKSLNKNVIRKGNEKINNGEPFKTETEEEVFKLLGLTYRKPEERDF